MHFDFLPKVIHNEDAIRDYEREENRRLKLRIKWLIFAIPVVLVIVWLILR
jgi:hypothetical protein